MARKEQILISELGEDAPERETVANRIITRSKETITKLTTVMATLKTKKATHTEALTAGKAAVAELTTTLTGLQAKIVTSNETLKLKLAERKSKRSVLKSYGSKSDEKTPSTEGAIVTQGMIEKLTTEIKGLRELHKTQTQTKNEAFSTKVTKQKELDLLANRVKVIDVQVVNIKKFISEVEETIVQVESKIKEELATKKSLRPKRKHSRPPKRRPMLKKNSTPPELLPRNKRPKPLKTQRNARRDSMPKLQKPRNCKTN
jgi:chromosome segregation ATPase